MYITNKTDDYNSTNIEEEDDNYIFKYSFLSIPGGMLLFFLIN